MLTVVILSFESCRHDGVKVITELLNVSEFVAVFHEICINCVFVRFKTDACIEKKNGILSCENLSGIEFAVCIRLYKRSTEKT